MKLKHLPNCEAQFTLTESEFLTIDACTGVIYIGASYAVDSFSKQEIDKITKTFTRLRRENGIEI